MNSQRETYSSFEEFWENANRRLTDFNEKQARMIWQAATEQGVNPVRGDSVSIDVSTSETTAGNRVFGTLTGERNGDPERTWLAELDHFNYPAEQGVGESVAWDDPAVDPIVSKLYRKFKEWSNKGFTADDVTWCEVRGYVAELINAHPPKPTGGCVPECFETLYKHAKGMTFGTDWNNGTAAKHHRLRLISAVGDCATYLATQQPPEQDTDK